MRRLNEKRTWSGRAGYIRLKALYNNPQCSIHGAGGSAYLRVHNIEKYKSAAGAILQSAGETKYYHYYYYYYIDKIYYHYFSARGIDEGVRNVKESKACDIIL